ncbi:related to GrpE protein homolog, mitochondrial [Saccharomycodes ludwigii]|uniref:GrpE protein homolog n=1 Tax=Saccharomycodes ludwigii TaxID=36035 RepID=A0A376B9U0_9ASCO|nr:hypothetical protein SCDLUD_002135 [Saccharomycodes ludwigii]KAH3902315.1 hypothetical protein SCDLUD_002135 [Saccharomycodes ludwigii]SSD60890.1 related to GrpE protein homolog, mitochondrial [Saccharomycodes ludwigii]
MMLRNSATRFIFNRSSTIAIRAKFPSGIATSNNINPSTLRSYSSSLIRNYRFYSSESKKPEEKEEQEEKKDEDENCVHDTAKVTELQEKLEKKEVELKKVKDHYLRSVADFRNLQETTKKDIAKAKDYALQRFAKDLLESVDNFGHALSSFKPESLAESKELADLYDGVKMTRDIFEKTLTKHGIQKLNPIGEQFDPNKHEATFELAQPDKEPGTVFHVQQVGFTLNDRVIRPAKVGVVKDPEN